MAAEKGGRYVSGCASGATHSDVMQTHRDVRQAYLCVSAILFLAFPLAFATPRADIHLAEAPTMIHGLRMTGVQGVRSNNAA